MGIWPRRVLLSWVVLLAAPSAAWAILIAEDRFLTGSPPSGQEYATGSLSGQNAITLGFSGPWFPSVGSAPSISATSLNYTDANFPNETGGRILGNTDSSRVHRLLSPVSNPFQDGATGTVYLSFLLQTDSGFGSQSGYRAFEMHYGGNEDGPHRRLQIGVSTFGDFPSNSQFGFRVNNSGALDFNLGSRNSNVQLFLVKFVLAAANNADSITVWRNPNISSFASDPTGGVTAAGINFAADRLGVGRFNFSTNVSYGLDELRIGTTLRDVIRDTLFCDVNGNGVCNSTDIAIISDNMYLPGTFAQGDIDSSGTIDFFDYRLFKDHPARGVGFDAPGAGGLQSLEIPEPTVAALIVFGALACWGRRWCRQRSGAAAGIMAGMLVAVLGLAQPAAGAEQDLLNDTIDFSGVELHLRPYTTLPAGFINAISTTTRPYDARLYITTQEGVVFVVNENADGSTEMVPWFNAAAALQTATGRSMNGSGGQQGLQSVAFHPDFETVGAPGYGKLYTTMLENQPANPNDPEYFYLGNTSSGGGVSGDGVLAEWTYDPVTRQVDPNSYRELFRVNMPVYDHPIKQARFNPYAKPGDEDYGLLYMTHGDANNQASTNDDPQDRGDVMGKMIRIDPLQNGADRYSIPGTNPFYSSPSPSPSGTPVLGEVYAYGFRNPHTFSFNQDDQGNVHILVGDIGRNNIEEVNLVLPGGNYGWGKREGTFVHLQGNNFGTDAGYITGVTDLAANEATVGVGPDGNRYLYPVAQYDHNSPNVPIGADYVSAAIASGFVIRNGSDPQLHNQFIFNNFGGDTFNFHSHAYHTDFDAMLNAVTQLDPNDTSRDHPNELTQAQIQRLRLYLDHDNNPGTPSVEYLEFNPLVGSNRNDVRYGEGPGGEMYITNKRNGVIYQVTNSVVNNRLTLTVDRASGEMSISNATGNDVTINALSVFSPSGSIAPAAFQGIDGDWQLDAANNIWLAQQANAIGSFTFDGTANRSLGNAYDAKAIGFDQPAGEDLQFLFTTAGDNGRVFAGRVVYINESPVITTIALTVDVATGRAVLLNHTPFAQEIEGYTISSAQESLNTGGWNPFEAQGIDDGDWLASPPRPDRLTEFQEDGTTTFDDQSFFELGEIYVPGAARDLVFEFQMAGEPTLRTGRVRYILAGDYNGDDVVDGGDYVAWRNALGTNERLPGDMTPGQVTLADYATWKQNYGEVWTEPGSGGLAGDSMPTPEPTAWALAVIAATTWLTSQRIRGKGPSPRG